MPFYTDLSNVMGEVYVQTGNLIQNTYVTAEAPSMHTEEGILKYKVTLEAKCAIGNHLLSTIDARTLSVFKCAMEKLHPIMAQHQMFNYFIPVLGNEPLKQATACVAIKPIDSLVKEYDFKNLQIITDYLEEQNNLSN